MPKRGGAKSEYNLLIGGQLVPGADSIEVINPANEELLALCPRADEQQLNEAITAAKAAYRRWASLPLADRRNYILRFADALEAQSAAMAHLLTEEQGKPLAEAEVEVGASLLFLRHIAAFELHPKIIEDNDVRRVEMRRRPLGVVAGIMPWNFPLLIACYKLVMALLPGNTMIIKPAPTTPLTTLRAAEIMAPIFPAGVVNIITDNNDLGEKICSHPDIAKVSFTGSTATGKKVMASAANTLKRITLELGGNDAAIVLPDANPKTAAIGIFEGAFTNAGQVCIAIKRVYAHKQIYDALCEELAKLASEAIVGDGLRQGTRIGPLQNLAQFEKVNHYLEIAHRDGKILSGGEALSGKGFFVPPTIVRDIDDGSPLVNEEQFGPVLPLIKFSNIDAALNSANNSHYGLGGSIWSSNRDVAYALATRMDTGTIWINKHLDFGPNIPFAGAKESGIGIEFGEEGMHEFTQIQLINEAR